MENPFIIRNDADAERFEREVWQESGVLTLQEWYDKTEVNNPPFNVGDKVMVVGMNGGINGEDFDLVRNPQTIERVHPVPCSDKPLWTIDLVGWTYTFTQEDLRLI